MTVTVRYATTVTNSEEWLVEQGLRLGVGIGVEAGIKGFGVSSSVHIDIGVDLKWGNIKSHVKTTEKSVKAEVLVRPKETLQLIWSVTEETLNLPWTVHVVYTGYVVAWFKENNGAMKKVFFHVGDIEHEQLDCLGKAKALFRAEGQFRGVRGESLHYILEK